MAAWIVTSLFAGWVVCGAIAYARTLAYFQFAYPSLARSEYASDVRFAVAIGVFGPVGLLASFIVCDKGMKWR